MNFFGRDDKNESLEVMDPSELPPKFASSPDVSIMMTFQCLALLHMRNLYVFCL